MREQLNWALFIGITIIGIPLIVSYRTSYKTGYDSKAYIEAIESNLEDKNKWTDIIEEEVFIGILAKQIPFTSEPEAIKVQAVISRTYMARRILGIETKGILTAYSIDEMKQLWGAEYDQIYDTYRQAIVSTCSEVIAYGKDIIEPLYHKSSSGTTRDAQYIYNKDIPYLKSVESDMDQSSKQEYILKQELINTLKSEYDDIVLTDEDIENQIQIIEKDLAGYVISLQIGNLVIDGEEFRRLINLPSACFEIYGVEDNLIFDVRGEGEGVGLSQNGANVLAEQGMHYQEIIKYYYTDIEIEKRQIQK